MSHFEATNIKKRSSIPAQQDEVDARAHGMAITATFDVAGIESLLVFWPDKLVDLSPLVAAQRKIGPQQDGIPARLLVGNIVHGHSCEAAVVIVGTIQVSDFDHISSKIVANGLRVVGSMPTTRQKHGIFGTSTSTMLADSPVWLFMSSFCPHGELPSVTSVKFRGSVSGDGHADICAAHIHPAPCAVTMIRYSVPSSRMLQYFALEPLRLAPVSGMKLVSTAKALLVPDSQLSAYSSLLAASSAPSELENKFLQLLMLDPLHWHSFRSVGPHQCQMPCGTALRRAIKYVNRLQAQHECLAASSSSQNGAGNGAILPSRYGIKASVSTGPLARVGKAATLMVLVVQAILQHPLFTVKKRAIVIDGVARRLPGSQARNWSLTSVSASARQLNVRISQLVVAPRLASRLRYLRKQQTLPIDEIAAPYIGLWNAVWLIANDVILGYAASVLLLQYRSQLAQLCRDLSERFLVDSILWLLSWLENWPAGLKLNTELSLFFSDAYSSLTIAWQAQGLGYVLPRLETIITAMAIAGRLMGVTMVFCMVQDLVSICTLHITVFYTLSFKTMRAFVYVLLSLFDMFRGKKRNALRGGRLDDASYELDQLLLGTLLFTLVAFLFPTVYVYYLAFGLIRFAVVAFEAGIVETCLALLNHLPMFALMLRVKDPHRLPAGVWLQELGTRVSNDTSDDTHALPMSRFRLRCRPLTVSDIFEGYGQHVSGLFEVPEMLLRCIFGRSLRSSPPTM